MRNSNAMHPSNLGASCEVVDVMSAKQIDLSAIQRHNATQPVYQHGLMSPPPLDDMFVTPEVNITDDKQSQSGNVSPISDILPPSFQALAARQLPPTPDSINQAAGYIAEEPIRVAVLSRHMSHSSSTQSAGEYSSMLDMPTQSPPGAERSAGESYEQQGSSKKQRRTSTTDSKDRSREKNKVAAAKCRQKKRDNMDLIESSHRALSAENSLLKRTEQQLRATVAELRTMALDHQSCSCGVHQFNMLEANKLAHGIGGMCNAGAFLQARKLSDPTVKRESPGGEMPFHQRAHSFAAPGQFSMHQEPFLSMHNGPFGEDELFEFDPTLNLPSAETS